MGIISVDLLYCWLSGPFPIYFNVTYFWIYLSYCFLRFLVTLFTYIFSSFPH